MPECPECGKVLPTEKGLGSHLVQVHDRDGIPEEWLIEAIIELGDELGRRPKLPEMEADGRYGSSTYGSRFDGGWSEAVQLAGYADPNEQPSDKYQYTYEQLEAEVRRLKDEYGYISAPLMDEVGRFSIGTYIYRYDSWNDGVRAAGVEINQEWKPDTQEYRLELARSVRLIHNRLDKIPTWIDVYEATGNGANYFNHFQSWDEVLEWAGLPPGRQTVECEHCSEELVRSRWQYQQQKRHFCNQSCFYDWRVKTGAVAGENNPHWAGGHRPRYGPGWTRTRREVLRRDGFKCRKCKMSQEEHLEAYDEQLHIHHVTPLKDFDGDYETANQVDNLVTLCKSCHKRWDHLPVRPEIIS